MSITYNNDMNTFTSDINTLGPAIGWILAHLHWSRGARCSVAAAHILGPRPPAESPPKNGDFPRLSCILHL